MLSSGGGELSFSSAQQCGITSGQMKVYPRHRHHRRPLSHLPCTTAAVAHAPAPRGGLRLQQQLILVRSGAARKEPNSPRTADFRGTQTPAAAFFVARAQSAIRLHQNRVLVDGFTRSRGSPGGERGEQKKSERKKPRRGWSGASSESPLWRMFLPLCPACSPPWVTWVLRSARARLRRRPDI